MRGTQIHPKRRMNKEIREKYFIYLATSLIFNYFWSVSMLISLLRASYGLSTQGLAYGGKSHVDEVEIA